MKYYVFAVDIIHYDAWSVVWLLPCVQFLFDIVTVSTYMFNHPGYQNICSGVSRFSCRGAWLSLYHLKPAHIDTSLPDVIARFTR